MNRSKKVIALSAGQGMASFIGIITVMIMARTLSKEDLAAYQQTLLAYLFVAPLLRLGIGQGLYYFLPGETKRVRGRVIDSVFVMLIMGTGFGALILAGGNNLLASHFNNPKVASLALWIIPYAIFVTAASQAASVFVVQGRPILASVFGVTRQLVIGGGIIIPLIVWNNVEASLVGNVIASATMAILAIVLMVWVTPPGSIRPSLSSMKELVRFSFPLGIASMIGIMTLQLDKLIVGILAGPEEYAVYALGAMEIPLIGIVTGSITTIMLAEMRQAVEAGKMEKAVMLFRLSSEKSAYILLPAMVYLWINASSIMTLLYGEQYWDSAHPFRIYLILLPIRCFCFGALLIALGQNRAVLIQSAGALIINTLLSVILVRFMGTLGAAVATVVTVMLWAVPYSLYRIAFETKIQWWNVLPFQVFVSILYVLVPVTIIVFLSWWCFDLQKPLGKMSLSALVFGVFLAYWWQDKLYARPKVGL